MKIFFSHSLHSATLFFSGCLTHSRSLVWFFYYYFLCVILLNSFVTICNHLRFVMRKTRTHCKHEPALHYSIVTRSPVSFPPLALSYHHPQVNTIGVLPFVVIVFRLLAWSHICYHFLLLLLLNILKIYISLLRPCFKYLFLFISLDLIFMNLFLARRAATTIEVDWG